MSILLPDKVTDYVKTKKFLRNLNGESFTEMHKLFEYQFKQLEAAIYEMEKLNNKLGNNTNYTIWEFRELTSIKKSTDPFLDSLEMIAEPLSNCEFAFVELPQYIADCSEKYVNIDTKNYHTGFKKEGQETVKWTFSLYLK